MSNAIILHGKEDEDAYFDPTQPASSNNHWLPWLQKQLIVAGINAQTPEIPNSWKPNYAVWQQEFEHYSLTPETILVGHSCGGGFLIRWLSEHPDTKVGRVVLVAPWIDPFHTELASDNTFFKFEIDPELAQRANITVFDSDNDMDSIHETIAQLRKIVPSVNYQQFHNYGHFCYEDMKTTNFPELLAACLAKP